MSGHCPTCGLPFASDASFDKHRVGSFCDHVDDHTGGPHDAACRRWGHHGRGCRRCLTVEEMEAGLPASAVGQRHGAWIEPRYTRWRRNAYGHWTHREAGRAFPVVPSGPRAAPEAQAGPEAEERVPALLGANGGAERVELRRAG